LTIEVPATGAAIPATLLQLLYSQNLLTKRIFFWTRAARRNEPLVAADLF